MNSFARRGVDNSAFTRMLKRGGRTRPRTFIAAIVGTLVCFAAFVRHYEHVNDDSGASRTHQPPCRRTLAQLVSWSGVRREAEDVSRPAPPATRLPLPTQLSLSGSACDPMVGAAGTTGRTRMWPPRAARATAARLTDGVDMGRSTAQSHSGARYYDVYRNEPPRFMYCSTE